MRVCTDNCRTIEEEFDYLEDQLGTVGNFFAWDVHPNKVKTAKISAWRLCCKKNKLIQSAEYKYYKG